MQGDKAMQTEDIWKGCLDRLAGHVSPQHFATWFKPIRPASGEDASVDGLITLFVPNRFFLEWVKEHYAALLQKVMGGVANNDLHICWKIDSDESKTVAAPKKASSKASSKEAPAKPKAVRETMLNARYTFDNFVVGKANAFAHAASSAITTNLASKYNPLFIYGCVGLGKTHLLQAIGHKVLLDNPQAKVCYYTSERFMNDFINYVSRQKMTEFRGKFRNVDVLLIDDIQFWAGKERTQEAFFHTFNTLYESHRQIVVTSDKYPKDIDGIEERLRSRFEWGLVADIQPPDIETKIAILRNKTKAEGIKIPDEVAEWVASVSGSNIRELEGFLNRIIAVSSLTGSEISLETSKEALRNLLKKKEEKFLTIEEIQKAVSVYFNMKFSDLRSKRRHKTIAYPRQVAMYISRMCGKFSYPEIGSSFGGKDHSTAIHAVKKIERDLLEKPELKHAVRAIKQSLGVS